MKIVYSAKAGEKVRVWVGGAKDGDGRSVEVGWIGTVDVVEGNFRIDEVWLPRQEVTSGSYEGDAMSIAEIHEKFIGEGGKIGRLRYWGHSHADGGVFQSCVDTDNSKSDAYKAKGFCVAVTWNTKGELYGEVTLFDTLFGGTEGKVIGKFDKIPVEVEVPETEATREALIDLVTKVKAPKPGYFGRYGNFFDKPEWAVRYGSGKVLEVATEKDAHRIAKALSKTKGKSLGKIEVVKLRDVEEPKDERKKDTKGRLTEMLTAPRGNGLYRKGPEFMDRYELKDALSVYEGLTVETLMKKGPNGNFTIVGGKLWLEQSGNGAPTERVDDMRIALALYREADAESKRRDDEETAERERKKGTTLDDVTLVG